MSIFDKVSKKMGLMDPEEENREQEMDDQKKREQNSREKEFPFERVGKTDMMEGPSNVVSFQSAVSARDGVSAGKVKVIVIEPKGFDDAQQVANCMREKRPVVINFEHTESEVAKRIIDFISGTTYALNGEIKKVGKNVFLCAPSNVNVTYTEEEKKVTTDMPWLKK